MEAGPLWAKHTLSQCLLQVSSGFGSGMNLEVLADPILNIMICVLTNNAQAILTIHSNIVH